MYVLEVRTMYVYEVKKKLFRVLCVAQYHRNNSNNFYYQYSVT